MKVTKQTLKDDFNAKYTDEGIFLPKDMCMYFLANEFGNEQQYKYASIAREVLEDFGMWLEGLLEVCDGVKGRVAYREN